MAVVCRYHKGRRHQHGIQYLVFVVYRLTVALSQLPVHYRHRFGIETSYRLKNTCRIRTTTKHPVVRFLSVALAFILVNLWIWLLWTRLSRLRRGGRRVYRELFPLKTMLEFLCHAIERRFPLIQAFFCLALVEACDLLMLKYYLACLSFCLCGYSVANTYEVLKPVSWFDRALNLFSIL